MLKRSRIIFCIILLAFTGSPVFAYDETYEKAVRHFRNREYRSAVPYLEKYALQKPDPAVYYMLGFAHYQLRNFDISREYFDQAYLLDPEFTSDKVPAHAGLSDEDQGLIHDALELSGARKQMGSFAQIVSSGIPVLNAGMNDERLKGDLLLVVRDSFRINRLYPSVVDTFVARFDRRRMLPVIHWLKSPLGRKASALEIEAGKPEMAQKAAASGRAYQQLSASRKERLQELEKAMRLTELTVHVISMSVFELLKGIQSNLPGGGKLDSEEIAAIAGNVRRMARDELTAEVLVSLAYAYSTLSDEELEGLIRFYRMPDGKWFNDTSIEAIGSAIGRASRESGEKIGKALALKRIAL